MSGAIGHGAKILAQRRRDAHILGPRAAARTRSSDRWPRARAAGSGCRCRCRNRGASARRCQCARDNSSRQSQVGSREALGDQSTIVSLRLSTCALRLPTFACRLTPSPVKPRPVHAVPPPDVAQLARQHRGAARFFLRRRHRLAHLRGDLFELWIAELHEASASSAWRGRPRGRTTRGRNPARPARGSSP